MCLLLLCFSCYSLNPWTDKSSLCHLPIDRLSSFPYRCMFFHHPYCCLSYFEFVDCWFQWGMGHSFPLAFYLVFVIAFCCNIHFLFSIYFIVHILGLLFVLIRACWLSDLLSYSIPSKNHVLNFVWISSSYSFRWDLCFCYFNFEIWLILLLLLTNTFNFLLVHYTTLTILFVLFFWKLDILFPFLSLFLGFICSGNFSTFIFKRVFHILFLFLFEADCIYYFLSCYSVGDDKICIMFSIK